MRHGDFVPGERTVAQMQLPRPLASRFNRGLAIATLATLVGGILTWYYTHLGGAAGGDAISRDAVVRGAVRSEMKLPMLHVLPAADSARLVSSPAVVESETDADNPVVNDGVIRRSSEGTRADGGSARVTLAAVDTGRASAVLVHPSSVAMAGNGVVGGEVTAASPGLDQEHDTGNAAPENRSSESAHLGGAEASAHRLATLRWLVPKGTFLDCTLETAIDSTLPGFVTCVLAHDVYGADGRVVLLERGTKLVGETRSDVRPGQARVAVLWTEARTPTGVIANLSSPGTDELGRAGTPGAVDTHIGARFGAAMLISMVDAAVSAVSLRQQGSGAVIYNTQGSRDVATEVLRNTVSIPPTVRVQPGTRVVVTVVRDIDFRGVYRLVSHDDK